MFAIIFLNCFAANTCRYSKTKKCDIEPTIRAEINYYNKLHLKKWILHKFLVSFVLLAMLLKYFRFQIHIPIEYLILNNLISKETTRTKNEGRKLDIA